MVLTHAEVEVDIARANVASAMVSFESRVDVAVDRPAVEDSYYDSSTYLSRKSNRSVVLLVFDPCDYFGGG